MRPRTRFVPAPRTLRERRVTRDNIALLPASLLPYKEAWQAIANRLPAGEVLIVTPAAPDSPLRRVALNLGPLFVANGHRVRSIEAADSPARQSLLR